jgi:phosphomannomutase
LKLVVDYIFDVDGTLTLSRSRIDKEFGVWFSKFCERNNVYLVTGSDRYKTIEQVGECIYHSCKRVYNCSGNDVYKGDENLYTLDWKLPELSRKFLQNCQYESTFSVRTGNHIEERPGMVNFSVVGRNASAQERASYVLHDTDTNERNTIVDAFNTMFPELHANVGGDIGIDIAPRGCDKSQVLKDFNNSNQLRFYGDKCEKGGNDYSIAQAISKRNNSQVYNVKDWIETWNLLK